MKYWVDYAVRRKAVKFDTFDNTSPYDFPLNKIIFIACKGKFLENRKKRCQHIDHKNVLHKIILAIKNQV